MNLATHGTCLFFFLYYIFYNVICMFELSVVMDGIPTTKSNQFNHINCHVPPPKGECKDLKTGTQHCCYLHSSSDS